MEDEATLAAARAEAIRNMKSQLLVLDTIRNMDHVRRADVEHYALRLGAAAIALADAAIFRDTTVEAITSRYQDPAKMPAELQETTAAVLTSYEIAKEFYIRVKQGEWNTGGKNQN